MNRILTILPLGIFALLCGCQPTGSENHADDVQSDESEVPTNRVEIGPTVRSNLGITFAKVERRSLSTSTRVPGAFELEPLATQEYRLMLPGRVEFAVDHLDEVQPGAVLYRLSSPEWLELQGRIDLARASVAQAEAKHSASETRLRALREAEFAPADLVAQEAELRSDLDRQRAELDAALQTAARLLDLLGAGEGGKVTPQTLLAPVDQAGGGSVPAYQAIQSVEVCATKSGFVDSLAVTDGAFVGESELVLTTIDLARVRFRAQALQGDLAKFAGGAEARISPPQAGGADINDSVPAKLTVGLAADPRRRTIALFAVPEEQREWIRPGVTAFLEVTSESTGGVVLAIPRSAVVQDGIVHVFFKRDPLDPNRATRVEADLGIDDGRWVEVRSELGPNDEVVLDGVYELKLATAQSGTAQKGGHFHADGTFHEDH